MERRLSVLLLLSRFVVFSNVRLSKRLSPIFFDRYQSTKKFHSNQKPFLQKTPENEKMHPTVKNFQKCQNLNVCAQQKPAKIVNCFSRQMTNKTGRKMVQCHIGLYLEHVTDLQEQLEKLKSVHYDSIVVSILHPQIFQKIHIDSEGYCRFGKRPDLLLSAEQVRGDSYKLSFLFVLFNGAFLSFCSGASK